MAVLLLPLLGPLHLRYPAFNAFTVRDILAELEPAAVATTALTDADLGSGSWQDTFELALPLAVMPWLRQRGQELIPVAEAPEDATAQADFFRYAGEMPALQEKLGHYSGLERQLAQALDSQLNLKALRTEILPLVREQQQELKRTAGDGPATGWIWQRSRAAAGRIREAAAGGTVAVLASLEHVPALEEALQETGIRLLDLPGQVKVSAEARDRTLLDQAMLAAPDSNLRALLDALQQLGSAEAGYARANLFMASGHYLEALELLETVSHDDFSEPYFLPGFLLARLGQLRDLAGKRSWALQAYRGVLALDWAPAEAVEVARAGLEKPFALPQPAG